MMLAEDPRVAGVELRDDTTLEFATAEVGQGFVTLAPQIARTVLGVDEVLLEPISTRIGSAGSTSASKGGAAAVLTSLVTT